MKLFVEGVLGVLFAVYIVLIVMVGIDAEMARRDFESGKAVQNCLFSFVCERYGDTNV